MRFKVLSKLKVQALAAHALLSRTVRVLQILSAFYIWSFCSASSLLCLSCGTFYFRFCLLLLWLLQFLFFSLYPLSLPLSLLSKISYICCRNNAWKLVHSWPTFLVVQWETERKKERGGSERTRKAEEWICCSFGSCRAKATTKKKSIYTQTHSIYQIGTKNCNKMWSSVSRWGEISHVIVVRFSKWFAFFLSFLRGKFFMKCLWEKTRSAILR